MESEIWRLIKERVGKLQPFNTEREMQSLLMNTPEIVGCWDPEAKNSLPALVKEEVVTKGLRMGRCDIIGIAKGEDGNYELRVFELKKGEINMEAVKQLAEYVTGWQKDQSVKDHLKNWILHLGLNGIDESNVDEIVNNPVGVLVGSSFSPEAIKEAFERGLKGIRLAKFKGIGKNEHEDFIIIENQIGEIIKTKKKYWSWGELIEAKLISLEDAFSISHQGIKLIGYPDKNFLNYNWIKIIFDEPSRKILLEKEEQIRENSKKDLNASKWIDKDLKSIKEGQGVWLSHATALCYFAFGGPTASWWVPTPWWKHEKSGKWLIDLVGELHKKKNKA